MIKTMLFALTLLFAVPVLAWDEPVDFRGLQWGASIQDMLAMYPRSEPLMEGKFGNRIQNFLTSKDYLIGDAKVNFIFGFLDGKFAHVQILFPSKDFTQIRRAFHQKYEPPHQRRQQELKSGFNVAYQNELEDWKGPTLRITLRKYGSRITDGYAIISQHAYDEEGTRALREKGEKGAKDL